MKNKALIWITIIGSIASIFSLAIAFMQLGWINSPDPDLVAEIEYGPFTYPPGLVESLPSGISRPFSHIGGYWSITLRNEGEKLAKSVVLRLPNVVYVSGEALVSNEFPDSIKIGDLQPRKDIRITAWSSSEPSLYVLLHKQTSDEIRLTHESGVGTVLIRSPIDPFWHEVANFWPIILIIIATPILGVIAWILENRI